MTNPADRPPWADAMAAFDAWADRPEDERPAFLAALANADAAVHAQVLALIRADRDAEEHSFLRPGSKGDAADARQLEGQRLGPWLVERLIGSGGMGQVWLARRTDGLYDGRAAIKLMRLAVADAGANARFAREGRLLGRLNHPHIARLLDAGVTPSGERYLVLEYVEGERIDRWCDTHRLGIAARVALFVSVCEAVAHAHENLIVHRDLKPSNIFVTDGGDVKLLDFGVAKLIDDEAGESTELTREAGAAMTPQYAAPEQLAGGAISTATDVYGLGMVLFGLLSGGRPYGPGTGATASERAEARPLAGPAADARQAEQVAAQRGTTVAALRKVLRGDLAIVVAKAIKIDPGERYRSVPELADDLRRTLDRRPITARRDSVAYRLRRYVQRHAIGVGASALIVLAILGGLAGTLVKQREAEREAARAVAIEQFLLSLFEQANGAVRAEGVQAREATINDVLAAGAKQIEHAFETQPAIRDEIFRVLVELYGDTGEPAQVVDLARKRVAAAHAGFGANDPRVVSSEVSLATVFINFGENDEATKQLAHAETVLDRAGDRSSLERARLLYAQGLLLRAIDAKPPWPTHPLNRAVTLLRDRYADQEDLLPALRELASEACAYGKADEARAAGEEMLRQTLATKGADNLFADEANWLFGGLLLKSGRAAEAIPLLERSIEGFTKHLGAKHPNIVVARFALAKAYLAGGRREDAERTIEIARQSVHRYHADDKRLERLLSQAEQQLADIGAGKLPRCGA